MFKENKSHFQISFFGMENILNPNYLKGLHESSEAFFYKTIFCNIREEDFKVLYSADDASRPNAPVNVLVSSIILKHKYNWSDAELFQNINYNILIKYALGLDKLDDIPFDESTYYNFLKRLSKHNAETGINLLEKVFDSLTSKQIKDLNLKTDIQRTDSMQACSNIRQYTRLQLLIEVLLRFWRLLSEADKELLNDQMSGYIGISSGKYLYRLKADQMGDELTKISKIYHFISKEILPKYLELEYSQIFERVYNEHFVIIDNKLEIRKNEELNSNCLQSPDDTDATYREKRKEGYQGRVINVLETASQDNPINLITDVSVYSNNTDDSEILNERIDIVKVKTPDINELHHDGGYGSTDNDHKLSEYGIKPIQTAVRGRKAGVFIEINQLSENSYELKCPHQTVQSSVTTKRFKAEFSNSICQKCEFADVCPAKEMKRSRTLYFTLDDHLQNQRIRNIFEIPPERRKIRPNVEATIKEFSCRTKNGKLDVRGTFSTNVFALATAIAINFGRIFRYKLQFC